MVMVVVMMVVEMVAEVVVVEVMVVVGIVVMVVVVGQGDSGREVIVSMVRMRKVEVTTDVTHVSATERALDVH